MEIADLYYVNWKMVFVRIVHFAILVRKRTPFGIYKWRHRLHSGGRNVCSHKGNVIDKEKLESKLDVPTFDDTYYAISVIHLQTLFYLLMLGHVLAVACFVTEIMWHRYRSNGRGL